MSEEKNVGQPLLEIRDLAVSFASPDKPTGRNQAVDGNSLTIYPAQTLAVVGESGCGKSVSALATLGLLPKPQARVDRGTVSFRSKIAARNSSHSEAHKNDALTDLLTLPDPDLRRIRGNEIAMIFQEPMTSLNPVITVGDQITEAIILHQRVARKKARSIALAAMKSVGIPEPDRRIDQYPHHFSGGMRQRVMIAMALSCQPSLLLADEPTTALDVTIQAQILELLRDLKRDRGMAILLITHDLGVVAENADVVAVMYAGRVVEYATVFELFERPLHPYTRALLACIPKVGQRRERLTTIHEVIEDEREFNRLGEVLPSTAPAPRPWWPTHTPPTSASPASTSGGNSRPASLLHELLPEHWVNVWPTPDLAPSRPPAISFRRN